MAIKIGQVRYNGGEVVSQPKDLIEQNKEDGIYNFKKTVTKIGVQGNADNIVDLSNIAFYLGKTGILDIEGWKITSFYPPYTENEGKEINPDFLIDVSWEE